MVHIFIMAFPCSFIVADPKTAGTAPEAQTERSDGVRLVMCPECGIGAEAKPGKKGGPSLQCLGCSEFFHEVRRVLGTFGSKFQFTIWGA